MLATRRHDDGQTVLPHPVARLVSKASKGMSLGAKAGFYVTETALETIRVGSIGSVGVFRRVVENIISKANEDTPGAGRWAVCGFNMVGNGASLAVFLTSISFHLAHSTLSRANLLTQDFIYVMDAVFGSTETSRAIMSILSLGRRELAGKNVQPWYLVFAMGYFSLLQAKYWKRTMEQIESHVLWDVVVLDSGEILTHQLPSSNAFGERPEQMPKNAFMKYIPKGSDYRITIDEESTRVVTVQFTSESGHSQGVVAPSPQVKKNLSYFVPKGAKIINEEVRSTSLANNISQFHYTLTFEERLHGFTERKGRTPHVGFHTRAQSLLESSVNQDHEHREYDADYPPSLGRPLVPLQGPMSGSVPMPMSIPQPAVLSKKLSSLAKNLPKMRSSHSHSANISSGSIVPQLPHPHVPLAQQEESVNSHPPSPILQQSQPAASPVLPSGQHCVHVDAEGHEISQQFGQSRNGSVALRSIQRKSSMCTIHSFDDATNTHGAYSTEAIEHTNNLMFPHGHLAFNMAKFVKFASAAYGESFMRIVGIASVSHPRSSRDLAQHYAFGEHTQLSVSDILLSSYTDAKADNESGIPLIHYVTVDHGAKAIVLTVRGTLGFDDMITDLSCEYDTFNWQGESWQAHKGMLKCARLLTNPNGRVMRTLKLALESWSDYGLVMCGHSLGGGVVSLLGILLSYEESSQKFVTSIESPLPGGRPMRCFCYGPPATICEELRKVTRPLIVSVVYGNDIIPCLSLGLLRDFTAVASETQKNHSLLAVARLILSGAPREDYGDIALTELERLRALMNNQKLVPPGEVYHLQSSTILDRQDSHGKTREATRLVASIVVDVDKRFKEPIFGRDIIHHNPTFYEEGLSVLAQGLSEAPWAR